MTTHETTIDTLDAIKERHRRTELALGSATGDWRSETRLDQEWLIAEVDRLRLKLNAPCGSCHPCTNYSDETWRAAGRKPPHVYEWDELRAQVDRVNALHPYMALDGRGFCGSCRDSSEDPMPWPCPTMAALGQQDGGDGS